MLELLFSFDYLKGFFIFDVKSKAMKIFKSLLFTLLTTFVYSQYCPSLGPDQFLPCGVSSTTLTADFSQCAPGSNPNLTTNYGVANIPYTVQTNTGAQLSMSDDSQQGPFNIGFTFCFFGQTYTQFWVGSNGWISFSAGQPTTFTSATIPSGIATVPKNCIMGPWQDWHPGVGGQIRYQIQGTAPCRKLVVSWTNVPMFSCTNLQGTFHIVIYESTNIIENYIQNKPNCLAWAGGTAVQGLHNAAGTVGIIVPGRNSTQWTANNDAWRYTPSGPTVLPIPTWYIVGNPVPIGQGTTITVTPPTAGANYTCQLVYPTCNAGWNSCNPTAGPGPDTVFVQPGPPNLSLPNIDSINPICIGDCNGEITATPINGTPGYTYTWSNGQTTPTATGLCAGTYSVTIEDAAGCDVTTNVTLVDPPPIVVGPITYSDTACFQANAEIYSVPDLGTGFTYTWNSLGNITFGQGSPSIAVDWTNYTAGNVLGAINVIATDVNGCESLPASIDLFILNIEPQINQIGPFCTDDDCVTLNALPLNGIFTGPGIDVNEFCPLIADTNLNAVVYTYIQNGCVFDDTINVQVNEKPVILDITNDQFYQICEGDSVTFNYTIVPSISGQTEWYFQNDTILLNSPIFTWQTEGIYILTAVHVSNGCISEPAQTTISIANCPQIIYYMPNSFTPDGDEFNQTFQPVFTSGFDPYDFQIEIYNRWGELIFESRDATIGWDGTYNGRYVMEGIYAWKLTFGNEVNDARYTDYGHVTILK
jgi:gliding motility-associated-like protein